MRSNLLFLRAKPADKDMAVEVFPTPPFCEAIEIIIVHSILGKLLHRVLSANFVLELTIAECLIACQEIKLAHLFPRLRRRDLSCILRFTLSLLGFLRCKLMV